MRIAVYGLPSSGKTTLIQGIKNAKILNGRDELERLSNGAFSFVNDEEKRKIRIQYAKFLLELEDDVIVSDGHYSFMDNIVYTAEDGDAYDVIFYLYCSPSELKQRLLFSDKNKKYAALSEESIKQWQLFEIESLRMECHKRNKDFYVISDNDKSTQFYVFLELVINGFSAIGYARKIAQSISDKYPIESYKDIYISDGDKTIIRQDTYRYCYDGKTNVFDGDFYSSYQSFLFSKDVDGIDYVTDKILNITLNKDVWDMINDKPYVIISSGITCVWNRLKDVFGFREVYVNPLISSDCKFYVVKLLREKGYSVTAFGDSKNDYYMLKESDNGYLRIGDKISTSLANTDLANIKLLYDKCPFFLSDVANADDVRYIDICKSNSGINGNRLAEAHMFLGRRMGRMLSTVYPAYKTAVLVLERGGRFFGDGLYSSFGGVFYTYNPSRDSFPEISQTRVVVVDSVINTGKSIIEITKLLKKGNPNRDIVIVSNVIQDAALELLADHKVFVVRSSANFFVGKRQASQCGENGPDTADRLYNIIDRSF